MVIQAKSLVLKTVSVFVPKLQILVLQFYLV